MRNEGYHMFAIIKNVTENPGSTAYEVARGLKLHNAWKIYTMLLQAEADRLVKCERDPNTLAMRWKVVVPP